MSNLECLRSKERFRRACFYGSVWVVPHPHLWPQFLQLHWIGVLNFMVISSWCSLGFWLRTCFDVYILATLLFRCIYHVLTLSLADFFWVCLTIFHYALLAYLGWSLRPLLPGIFLWYLQISMVILLCCAAFHVRVFLEGVSIVSLLEEYYIGNAPLPFLPHNIKRSCYFSFPRLLKRGIDKIIVIIEKIIDKTFGFMLLTFFT